MVYKNPRSSSYIIIKLFDNNTQQQYEKNRVNDITSFITTNWISYNHGDRIDIETSNGWLSANLNIEFRIYIYLYDIYTDMY